MSTKSTPKKKTSTTVQSKGKNKGKSNTVATKKPKTANPKTAAPPEPSSAPEPARNSEPVAPPAAPEPPEAPPAAPPVAAVPEGPQPNTRRPLSEAQHDLDLLSQINLALGIEQLALFGPKGLLASRQFKVSRKDTLHLLDWLDHRLDAAIKAMQESGEEPAEVRLANLIGRFGEPPQTNADGTVHVAGSDMYTLVFVRRGHLWLAAALDYELDSNYTDFNQWKSDLLAMLTEFGL